MMRTIELNYGSNKNTNFQSTNSCVKIFSAMSLLVLLSVLLASYCNAKIRYDFRPASTPLKTNQKLTKMTSDATGKYLAALDHTSSKASIHISADYGLNWSLSSATSAKFSDITSDSTGKYLAATIHGGRISLSDDYGATWTQHDSTPKRQWTSIDCSADCMKIVASVHQGGLFTSIDRGLNWHVATAPHNATFSGVSSDASGVNLVAVATSGEIYYSKDSGHTWKKSEAPGNYWTGVSSDSTGQYVAAVSSYGGKDDQILAENGVFYSSDYGQSFELRYAKGQMTVVTMDTNTGSVLSTVIKDSCGSLYIMQSFDRGMTWGAAQTAKGAWSHLVTNAAGDRLIATQSKNGLVYTAHGTEVNDADNKTTPTLRTFDSKPKR